MRVAIRDREHRRRLPPRGSPPPALGARRRAQIAFPPLPSLPFGTNDEIEKDSADRRAGWEGN